MMSSLNLDQNQPKQPRLATISSKIRLDHLLGPGHRVWLNNWIKTHKPESVLLAIITLALLAIGGSALYGVLHPQPKPAPVAATAPPKKELPPPPVAVQPKSPLTGLGVESNELTKRQVTAIMLENSPSARPQSGLKTAGVIFEAIAEGGITRFLALYQESRPGLIGPVRSLRPYYIDWLLPFDAAVAHVGGSYNALNEIRSGKYKDIDEFFNGGSYWRASDRYAPHNVYTNFDKLDALNTSKGYTSSTFTGFARKAEMPNAAPSATAIDISISSALYDVHYDYDKASNSYLRSEGGAPHNDREGGRLTPKVVVVMKVPMHLGFEDGYREQMDTVGSGPAYVFQDGVVTQGTWNKPDRPTQITFKDSANNQIAFNPGQTWITDIPTEKSVTWR